MADFINAAKASQAAYQCDAKTIEEGMKTVKQKLTDTKNKLMTEINAAAAAQKAIQKEGWRQLVKSVRKRQEY
jgi:hypothetical protein